jgi:hypothetical protein
MNKIKLAAAIAAAGFTQYLAVDIAQARGGADFMNSYGYQRRLQESRGYVTNESGSILPHPVVPVRRRPAMRHRH